MGVAFGVEEGEVEIIGVVVGDGIVVGVEEGIVVDVGGGVDVIDGVGDGVVVVVGVGDGVEVGVGDGVAVVAVGVGLSLGVSIADFAPAVKVLEMASVLVTATMEPISENSNNMIESIPTVALAGVSLAQTAFCERRAFCEPGSRLFFI